MNKNRYSGLKNAAIAMTVGILGIYIKERDMPVFTYGADNPRIIPKDPEGQSVDGVEHSTRDSQKGLDFAFGDWESALERQRRARDIREFLSKVKSQ